MVDRDMQSVVGSRLSLANTPDDTIEQVRVKERLLSALQQPDNPLHAWRSVANLWCAQWFRRARGHEIPTPFAPLFDELLGRGSTLPRHIAKPLLDDVQAVANRERFFHWQLEFPEVFHEVSGQPSAQPGFDAVVGNPPWEMLRGSREFDDDGALTDFSRTSGAYRWQGDGHANLYQIFLERAFMLTRPAGRIAIVLPSGFALDHGCAHLRSALLERSSIDTFVTVENRDALFPIHRGLKFLLLTTTRGGHTTAVPCRSGVRSAAELDSIPDVGGEGTVDVPRSVIEKFSGDQLAIPEVRTQRDVAIVARTAFLFSPLSSEDGWNVTFGRELNATDDRQHFVPYPSPGCLPVLEGKQIEPFAAHTDRVRRYIAATTAARLLGPRGFTRRRLAYRDVAAASNRLTLIAAIVPADVVTTHTLFCIRNASDYRDHLFLCGIFNSFVANYLVRMRVGTHVNTSIIGQLPVPRPPRDSPEFQHIVALVGRVMGRSDAQTASELQASVARLYRLDDVEFRHVLDTFPLVPVDERTAALRALLQTAAG